MVGQTFDVLLDATSRRRPSELSGRTTGNTVVNRAVAGARRRSYLAGPFWGDAFARAGPNSRLGRVSRQPADRLLEQAGA